MMLVGILMWYFCALALVSGYFLDPWAPRRLHAC